MSVTWATVPVVMTLDEARSHIGLRRLVLQSDTAVPPQV